MFTLSAEAMANFEKVVTNLDAYAVDINNIPQEKEDSKKKNNFILV